MTLRTYTAVVVALRFAPRWLAAGLAVSAALAAIALTPNVALAAENSPLEVTDGAVIMVGARGHAQITVRGWDRQTVQVTSEGEGDVTIAERTAVVPNARLAAGFSAPLLGNLAADQPPLPPEDFPWANFRSGQHDIVQIAGAPDVHMTISVPANTAALIVRAGGAQTLIEGYRGANLAVQQFGGRVAFTNVATAAFVQMNQGVLTVADSAFDRIRFRGDRASAVFERCRSRQIETSTIAGHVLYDNGTFDAGLARFESRTGNIAIGAGTDTRFEARSGQGRVLTNFDRRADVQQRREGEASATLGGGGALVNASTESGTVFLYDGSLRTRHVNRLPQPWHQVHREVNGRRGGRR